MSLSTRSSEKACWVSTALGGLAGCGFGCRGAGAGAGARSGAGAGAGAGFRFAGAGFAFRAAICIDSFSSSLHFTARSKHSLPRRLTVSFFLANSAEPKSLCAAMTLMQSIAHRLLYTYPRSQRLSSACALPSRARASEILRYFVSFMLLFTGSTFTDASSCFLRAS